MKAFSITYDILNGEEKNINFINYLSFVLSSNTAIMGSWFSYKQHTDYIANKSKMVVQSFVILETLFYL